MSNQLLLLPFSLVCHALVDPESVAGLPLELFRQT